MRNLDDLPFHLSKPFTESADLKWDTASVLAWLRGLSQAELTVALYSILQHAAQSYEHILFFIQALTERENWLAQIDDLIGIGDIELPNWALQTGENVQERDGALSSHGASIAGEEIESKLAREFLARSDRYQSPLGNLAIARPRKLRKPKVSLLRESTDWQLPRDSFLGFVLADHYYVKTIRRRDIHGDVFQVEDLLSPDTELECKRYDLRCIAKNTRAQRIRNLKKLASNEFSISSINHNGATYVIYSPEKQKTTHQQARASHLSPLDSELGDKAFPIHRFMSYTTLYPRLGDDKFAGPGLLIYLRERDGFPRPHWAKDIASKTKKMDPELWAWALCNPNLDFTDEVLGFGSSTMALALFSSSSGGKGVDEKEREARRLRQARRRRRKREQVKS